MAVSVDPNVSSTDSTEPSTATDSQANTKLVNDLVGIWRSFQAGGFAVRMKVGKLLNARLRPPTKRLPHGRQVLKKAAEQMHVSEGDLSRMRWFAYHFSSVEEFEGKYPDICSWAEVKRLLPTLRPNADKARTRGRAVGYGRVVRSLTKMVDWFRTDGQNLDDSDKEKMRDVMEELLPLVCECLNMNWQPNF